jgi:D-Tyr-tRNAtyr deacylase
MMKMARWAGMYLKLKGDCCWFQFTLMAQTQKGLRPDFGPAMPPSEAKEYEQLVTTPKSICKCANRYFCCRYESAFGQ